MYHSDQTLWIMAQARQQELLEEVRIWRLARQLQASKGARPTLWQQLIWNVGGQMIAFGHRLQTQQKLSPTAAPYSDENLETSRRAF